jgi:hypothetical protein
MDIIRKQERKPDKHTEKNHTCKIIKDNLQMKDADIDTRNPIFRALQEMNTSSQYTTCLTPYVTAKPTS